ncbi:MAG TPA: hypothetical protein VLC09_15110 [Polyangiaceae bacterium]|nr:hypothetical protein [Polyangiaceae bacterium]
MMAPSTPSPSPSPGHSPGASRNPSLDAEALREDRPVAPRVDSDALLVALVVAPGTYSRNKYFTLFQDPEAHRTRRRAQLVRSILKDLTEPWPAQQGPHGRVAPQAVVVAEMAVEGGTRLVYRVEEFDYTRSAILTPLELSALRFALARAGRGAVSPEDRRRVESALARIDPTAQSASGGV